MFPFSNHILAPLSLIATVGKLYLRPVQPRARR